LDSMRIFAPLALLFCITLACGGSQRAAGPVIPPTRTPLPTFTVTPISAPLPPPSPAPAPDHTPTPIPVTDTPAATFTPVPSHTPAATTAATVLSPSPSNTPVPTPTVVPADTPTPEPIIRYVIAGSQREFNCSFTYINGAVKDANNSGIPDVEVRALGIHETSGLEFVTRTDAEGRFEVFRFPLADLLAGQWAVMIMEDGREVSERFHWASTPVCESNDLGHSQVLRLDWKLVQ
jgi:hypothetical protein